MEINAPIMSSRDGKCFTVCFTLCGGVSPLGQHALFFPSSAVNFIQFSDDFRWEGRRRERAKIEQKLNSNSLKFKVCFSSLFSKVIIDFGRATPAADWQQFWLHLIRFIRSLVCEAHCDVLRLAISLPKMSIRADEWHNPSILSHFYSAPPLRIQISI